MRKCAGCGRQCRSKYCFTCSDRVRFNKDQPREFTQIISEIETLDAKKRRKGIFNSWSTPLSRLNPRLRQKGQIVCSKPSA